MKNAPEMKPPFRYYGGKQMMVKHILPVIPDHDLYTEAFLGGAAIYFAKKASKLEVINDLNDHLINFYRVLQLRFDELKREVKATLHSRKQHKLAYEIYRNPEGQDEVKRAWAIWVLCNQGFAGKMDASWGYDKTSNGTAKSLQNAKYRFTDELRARIEYTQIECNDAVKVIQSRDKSTAFHYVDPPYVNSHCGHYKGYTWEDFEKLLKACQGVKGKFLLSSYHSEMLSDYTSTNGWYQVEYKKAIAVSKHATGTKTEVLTANYPIYKTDKHGFLIKH